MDATATVIKKWAQKEEVCILFWSNQPTDNWPSMGLSGALPALTIVSTQTYAVSIYKYANAYSTALKGLMSNDGLRLSEWDMCQCDSRKRHKQVC